ncbi:MAG: HAD family hydrolase [Ruminococcaceae bacterium]|nr:HAD family hydrolase [Oscillospiraceae bacterium]
MKKFEGVLFCSDLDGTLLASNHDVSAENLKAIEYFKSEGGFFTFVTGRMPYFVSAIYNKVNPNAPFGCINGGGLYDHREERYIWTQALSHDVLALVDYAVKHFPEVGVQINAFDRLWFCRENRCMEDFRRATKVPHLVCDHRDFQDPIAKILFGDRDADRILRLREELEAHPLASSFGFINSEPSFCEILPKGLSKGTLLEKLAEHLGVSPDKTIAIGDYQNDISMIQTAKLGFAVANACQEAKEAADFVTVSNNEHAIARVIEGLDRGKFRI